MVVLDYAKTRAPLRIWACGDWHVSALTHDAPLFAKHFQRAVKERWPVIHVGDALEMVTPSSRVAQRGALREQTADPEEQRKALITYLKQLAGGVILPGNHEFRVDMASGLDFIASITDAVGKTFTPLSEPGFIEVRVGKQRYRFYVHHGEGPVVAVTTLFDRLQRDTEGLDAILCGHIHAGTFDPATILTPDGPRSIKRFRTGHYLRPPKYALIRPVSRIGACGSWLLTLDPVEHHIGQEWLD